jgi:hypothetical protein
MKQMTRVWLGLGLVTGALGIACVVENVTPDAPPYVPPPVRATATVPLAPPVVVAPPVSAPPAPSAAAPPATSAAPLPPAAGAVDAPTPVVAATDPPPAAPSAGDFYSCHADADCVAVAKNACCNHGDKEAVNKDQAQAYKSSFTCPEHRPCPMFMRRDNRVPVCNGGTHRCEMVPPPAPAPAP